MDPRAAQNLNHPQNEYYFDATPQFHSGDAFDNKNPANTYEYGAAQDYAAQGYAAQGYGVNRGSYHQPEETVVQWFPEEDFSTPPPQQQQQQARDATPKPREEHTFFLDRFQLSWMPEIASEVFSAATLIALIVLLSRIDGRPLSTWTIAVSPNAVISILSIAARASLIFSLGQVISQLKWLHLMTKPDSLADLQHYDDASRGPLGAIRIFWTVWPASLITYIACFTVILSLAFEPFSQQLLHFAERSITVPGAQSTVSYSKAYDYGSQGVGGASAVISRPRDNGMTAAIVNGLYDVANDPPMDCPGSTCSYPDFTTLGVCSECLDVTTSTTMKQLNMSFGVGWTFTTPNNLSMQAVAYSDAHSGLSYTTINATYSLWNPSFAGLGMPMNASVIRFPETDDAATTIENWADSMEAYQCVVSYCGRRFVGWHTVNGTNTTGEQHIVALNNSDVPAYDAPWNRVLAPLDPAESLDTGTANNSFLINYLDGENLANIFINVFTVGNEGSGQIGVGALTSSKDVIASMENMANDISYHMMSNPNSTITNGSVFATETYIAVRWPWIALLVIIAVSSALSLVTVIIMTRSARQVAWKSSLNPLLMSDVAYPLTTTGAKKTVNGEDYMQLQTRTRTIASHLTRQGQ